MNNNLSIITPTGMRPEAFKLCEKWMARQTLKPDEWIVVDDGFVFTEMTLGQKVIRPEIKWDGKTNTQGRNLKLALEVAKGDLIAFIEDDDWYHSQYLELIMQSYSRSPSFILGEQNAIFYHIGKKKWRALGNKDFCCLAQTVIYKDLIPEILKGITKKEKYLDKYIWNAIKSEVAYPNIEISFIDGYFPHNKLVLGIKGLPGRDGIVSGHKWNSWWNYDPDWSKLKSIIGEDFKEYENLWKQMQVS